MNPFIVALCGGFLLTGIARALLLRHGVMDRPNHRSAHVNPTPRGGGVSILPSAAIAVTLTNAWELGLVAVFVGSLCLGIVGMIDDLRSVSALRRLAVQLAVGLGCAAALSTGVDSPTLILIASVTGAIWLAGVVNAYNFMDGANGLAASAATVCGLWFGLLGHRADDPVMFAAGLALAGAAAGFLPWNFPRARVFMGDVGSYSVGFLLGGLALLALSRGHDVDQVIAPLLVLLCDAVVTLVRRIVAGEPPMDAHQDHAYQRLTDGNGAKPTAALAVSAASVACVAATWLPLVATLAAWGAVLGIYMALPWMARAVRH